MSWVRLDDHFPEHPKWLSIGPFLRVLGVHLHVNALCWCNRHLTDGQIPVGALIRLMPEIDRVGTAEFGDTVDVEDVAKALVEAGIWETTESGYAIHDYLHYQPSRSDVEVKRELLSNARRQAGEKGRLARQANQQQTPSKPSANIQQTDNNPEARQQQTSSPNPNPNPNPKEDAGASSSAREGGEPTVLFQRHPIHSSHKAHALCSHLCLPASLMPEFRAKSGKPESESYAYVCAWFDRVNADWQGKPIGDDDFKFWRLRWAEAHPTTKKATEGVSWIDTIPSAEQTRKMNAEGRAIAEENRRRYAERKAAAAAAASQS